ncbi:uncharacterized protein P884DRAFT_331379 [Thermothelomyces heterothallicus CBS 202.75]|uniref:uncharacterized protein n=1 Tax=Thermothelomyces heterothallicus CBS 202.75 TaxID=1149848 RepID=UPI0037424243
MGLREKFRQKFGGSQALDDTPIRRLRDLAYDKLREEEEGAILAYEKKLQVCGDLGSVIGTGVPRRERMTGLLQRKMDEVNRDSWELRFGSHEVLVKDLAEPVCRDSLDRCRPATPATLETLYGQILKFQVTAYCYYTDNSAYRLGLDVIRWHDWDELLDNVRERERVFDRRHLEAMARWDAVRADVRGLREAVESAQRDMKRAALLKWLCDIDPSEMYNTASDKHEEGTGDWLREDDEFRAWEKTPGVPALDARERYGVSPLPSTPALPL